MGALVSIVLPVFNAGKYIRECLESIVTQSYVNLEILIINDGSTDDSGEIIEEYSKKDSRIKVITNKNRGVSYSRNCGIDNATGDYIVFIDSDDIVSVAFIEKMLNAVQSNSDALVLCRYKTFEDKIFLAKSSRKRMVAIDKGFLANDFYKLTLLGGLLYGPVVKMYNSEIIKKYNLHFDSSLSNGEDQIFNFEYYQYIREYILIDEELYFYRIRSGSLSRAKTKRTLNDLYLAREKLKIFLIKNHVANINEIVASHCMTDLIEYTSVDNDGYKGYKERLKKIQSHIELGLDDSGIKKRLIKFLIKHSIFFPLYVFYKFRY